MWHFLAKIHFPCLPQVKGGHFPLVRPSSLQSWHTITIQVYTLVSLSLRRVTTYIRGQSMTNSFLGTHLVPAVDYPPRLLSPLYLLTYIPLLFPRFFIYNLQKLPKNLQKYKKYDDYCPLLNIMSVCLCCSSGSETEQARARIRGKK